MLISISFQSELKTKTALTEDEARTLMLKYQPVFYFKNGESAYPTAIEDFKIDWTKAKLGDKTAQVDTKGFKGNSSLKSNTPIYSSVVEQTNGELRITYMILYGWNGAGPTFSIKAKCAGMGIDKDIEVGKYGAGVHYSDVEHIEVNLNSNRSLKNLVYAYHEWTKTYSKSDLTWENSTHPVVYASKGSHASYSNAGEQKYLKAWDVKKKKLGVTIYDSKLYLKDYTSKDKRWYSKTPRLLKWNTNQASGISNDELYVAFKYKGRLGAYYDNDGWDKVKSVSGYNTFYKALKKISNSAARDVAEGMSEVEGTMESGAPNAFYGRKFW
jgi:hypothetical protein